MPNISTPGAPAHSSRARQTATAVLLLFAALLAAACGGEREPETVEAAAAAEQRSQADGPAGVRADVVPDDWEEEHYYLRLADARRCEVMRFTPAHRCIEIGNIYWGPGMAGTRVATEALYLFAVYVLETLGYRRFEWKCDALNAPSRRAAERFGFTWEGHFRRAVIVRGRTRDTAWFSMIDEEWAALKAAYQRWLAPENFDADGRQKTRLSELTALALAA